jgi:hypothetical protein
MKQLKEILEGVFDKDLVIKKTSAEKEIEHFRNRDIAKMSSEDIMTKIHSIMNSCEKYTYDELKKHPIDTLEHVIILPTYGGYEVDDYTFVYSKDIPNWGIESVFSYIAKKTKNWTWCNYPWGDFDRFKDNWEKKVDCLRNIFIGSNVQTFYVIPEILSKDLIKRMSGK